MALSISLPEISHSLRSDTAKTRARDVRAWWDERPEMLIDEDSLPLLADWMRRISARNHAHGTERKLGYAKTFDQNPQPLIQWLTEKARAGEPFTFNALHVERRGGRTYPYFIPAYTGPVTISRDRFQRSEAEGDRLLITNMTRDIRKRLELTGGMVPLEADFRACHAHIALALSGDSALQRDLEGDIHQVVGDAMAPHVRQASRRRLLGKHINNSMFFGVTRHGLARIHKEELGVDAPKGWTRSASMVWWSRYRDLQEFCAELRQRVDLAQATGQGLVLITPSGRPSKYSPADVQGRGAGRSRGATDHEAAWRSIFSGVFRAVEGDLLSRTIARFHADRARHGGAPALPIYDGLLLGAPEGREEQVRSSVKHAANAAAEDVGVHGQTMSCGD